MSSGINAYPHAPARASWLELIVLKLMRIGIGWHFAYEGLTKLLDPTWTAKGYLESAGWLGAEVFHWMAANPAVLQVVDLLNAWGLFVIGVALILGCFTRIAAILGALLLMLYYVAHPSLFGTTSGVAEGTYLIQQESC
jgi:thiosulfate dehydrogenase [quinone] large subunit